ncbi:GNAT family N-acetyltransferase [Mycolicibacterium fortuitum]|uniref:GNAT family N-acetyltransferase n=2 Tax=Mycolicibacterium fortuitum TaxID=1766 RepID=A0AAE4VFU4_MYCFO|nr:GNAT family N-acetyltransferase [Mycolicibacterium fortuitum]MCV7139511.1 GNAT family N-acetyltransferase [Mycolicibacterium fortuitum]MDV7193783.1 GNAT family N-acetyltransferase [Mycolicibacterium fortuitum]MDV7207192.1 GNAT family N-acetyltransferase [Mycolicibacterium fortuitum]MDV7228797.1 GNAT family N-acetyltransferase [Mycolicibacterium fortuitum]MDV7260706.1 GNAT family N-acetyltransferase [Mycolicibacterium fortuitum]
MVASSAVRIVSVDSPDLVPPLTGAIAALLQRLVSGGAALGWVDPPTEAEVAQLLGETADAVVTGDAALLVAEVDGQPAGFAYWRRYTRRTHRPHADVEKVAVDPRWQGLGIGRRLLQRLIRAAAESHVEVLTLDLRGDNERAAGLYESLGFERYGLLERFVAVGERRYDKLFYALDLRQRSTDG